MFICFKKEQKKMIAKKIKKPGKKTVKKRKIVEKHIDDNFYYKEIAIQLEPLIVKEESYDLGTDDLPILPNGCISYEVNLMEFPVFTKNKKIGKNVSMKYVFNEEKEEYIKIIPSNNDEQISNKIPQEFDEKIFYGLLRIYEENGNKEIISDYASLMAASGVRYNKGKNVLRTKDSLERLRKSEIVFNGIYFDMAAKDQGKADYIKRTKSINLLSNLEFIEYYKYIELEKGDYKENLRQYFEKHNNIKTLFRARLNKDMVSNIDSKAFKYFKHQDLIDIENSTARKLYVMLTKWRHWQKSSNLKRSVKFLASRIPLSWKKGNISMTVRSLLRACENLKKLKKIADFEHEKKGKLTDSFIIFYFEKKELDKYNQIVGTDTTGQEYLRIEYAKEEVIDIEPIQIQQSKLQKERPLFADILALIPENQREKAFDICNQIFQIKGKDCLRWYIEYIIKANGKKSIDNFGAYLRTVCCFSLWEKHLEDQKLIAKQLKIEQQKTENNRIRHGTVVSIKSGDIEKEYSFDKNLQIHDPEWIRPMSADYFKFHSVGQIISQSKKNE